jgi:hypothetical protein
LSFILRVELLHTQKIDLFMCVMVVVNIAHIHLLLMSFNTIGSVGSVGSVVSHLGNESTELIHRIRSLPKPIQNLIDEYNCAHRPRLSSSLQYILAHRECPFCFQPVCRVDRIFLSVRFFCDTYCYESYHIGISRQ